MLRLPYTACQKPVPTPPLHVVPHLLVPNLQVSELVKSWATKGAVNKVEFVSFSQDPNPRPLLLPADERVVES